MADASFFVNGEWRPAPVRMTLRDGVWHDQHGRRVSATRLTLGKQGYWPREVNLQSIAPAQGTGDEPNTLTWNLTPVGNMETVAILPFTGPPNLEDQARAYAGLLTNELAQVPKYRPVERSRMNKLLSETRTLYSGTVESAAKTGKLLGAQKAIIGEVSDEDGRGLASLTLRFVDVSSAAVECELGIWHRRFDEANARAAIGILVRRLAGYDVPGYPPGN